MIPKMGCTPAGYKTFLVCCNVALLLVGLSVLILGLKMKWAMSVLLLINIPIVMKAIKAVIATGFFISVSGVSGIFGASCESMWLLIVHLVSLGSIVIMEFSLGVTLMIVKKTIGDTVESSSCNSICAASVDAIILDYALPSAGLMMTVIFVEALMIYFSIKLFLHIRDQSKVDVMNTSSQILQNVPMQNVAALQNGTSTGRQFTNFSPAHQLQYAAVYQHRSDYIPVQYVPTPVVAETQPPVYNSLSFHPPSYPHVVPPQTPE